ncbi:hypothetical protein AALO_G00036530 [Alosa alosa]|uniref:Immunoglobulin C1-set domain-containing protein n=1 Tax=Alosa alosa TaxID=278164 RepID=A0AAV6H9X1_9TELE|nr:hypothetical protein AALO_G00036530 [Alosa alosa]
MPYSDLAVPVAEMWNQENNRNNVRNHVYGVFLQNKCWDALYKTARGRMAQSESHKGLEVYMFAKPRQGITGITGTYLMCHVTSSDLSGVRIQLTKAGVPQAGGVNLTGPRPNGDGTVQMRVQVQLERKDAEEFQCQVQTDKTHRCLQWAERADQDAEQIKMYFHIAKYQWEYDRHVAVDDEFYIRTPLTGGRV